MSLFGDTLKDVKKIKKKKIIHGETEIKTINKKKKKKYKPSNLIVVKKDLSEGLDDEKVKEWLATAPGFLEGLTKVNDKRTKLYDYQIAHLNNRCRFRCINKARQIGFSFGCISGEALAKSQLCDINTSIFISYNQEEANEKIIHVQSLYDSIPEAYKKKRITDNKHSQIFRNKRGQTTRIISTAQRPPRGKGFNTDVYGDEFAFWQFASKIFTAAAPVISRGTGVLTIGSTPFGSHGKFYDILTDLETYPEFSRQNIPWWHCPDLCKNIVAAFKDAPKLKTEERVFKFANEILKLLFKSMPLDDFQQEYELGFIDENISYFPQKFVDSCIYPVNVDEFDFDEFSDTKGSSVRIDKADKSPIELKYPKIKFYRCNTIEELSFKVNNGDISPNLFAGYDVGRKKDKAELYIIEEIPVNNDNTLQVLRFGIQFDRKKFEEQKTYLRLVMNNIPIIKLAIDAMGIGMNLAEDMATDFQGRVEEVPIEMEWKDRTAQLLRIRFENQLLAIPDDQQLKKQISSIKKKLSATGNVTYDAEKDKEHHGDKLWALALACSMGQDISAKSMISSIVGGGSRLTNKVITKKKKIDGMIQQTPGIINDMGGIVLPGYGSIPSPIGDLLNFDGDNLIDFGSSQWLSDGFHMPIKIR